MQYIQREREGDVFFGRYVGSKMIDVILKQLVDDDWGVSQDQQFYAVLAQGTNIGEITLTCLSTKFQGFKI